MMIRIHWLMVSGLLHWMGGQPAQCVFDVRNEQSTVKATVRTACHISMRLRSINMKNSGVVYRADSKPRPETYWKLIAFPPPPSWTSGVDHGT